MQPWSFKKHLGAIYHVPGIGAGDIEAGETDTNLWLNLAPKDTEKNRKAKTKVLTYEMGTSPVARFWTRSSPPTEPMGYGR